jgi:hypothetical protein
MKMQKVYKATISYEVFITGESQEDAHGKLLETNKKIVVDKARLKGIDVDERPYEVIE